MALEDYFEFAEPDVIRLRGHRIFLEHIIERWLNGSSPERITQELSSLTLEEVDAAITYYLHNKQELDAYLARARAAGAAQVREADEHPDAVMLRMRALKEQQRPGAEGRSTATQSLRCGVRVAAGRLPGRCG